MPVCVVETSVTHLRLKDIEAALYGFTPASLRSVELHTPGQYTWQDVGGLHEVKYQLTRMLEWPAKVCIH